MSRALAHAFRLTLALSAQALSARAQTGTIVGHVIDAATAAPLSGASIATSQPVRRVIANAQGSFRLTNMPAGDIVLRVTRIGYAELRQTVTVAAGTVVDVEIRLATAATTLTDITVTAGAAAEEVRQSPFSVTVIEGRQLAGRGLTLDEALQRATGVQVRRGGGLGSASIFNIRGLEGQRVQVYIDGSAANIPGNAFTLDDIPLQLIDRVEVYKGVVPARFGGDGLGAAINVVTIHPEGGYADVGVTSGSYGLQQLASVAQHPFERIGLEIAGSLDVDRAANDYVMQSPFVPELVIRRDHDHFRRVLAAAVFKYSKAWFDELRLELVAIDARREIQGIQTNVQHAVSGSHMDVAALEAERQGAAGGRVDLRTALLWMQARNGLTDTSAWRYTFDGERYLSPNGRGELGLLPADSDNRTAYLRHRTAATYRLSPRHTANVTYLLDLSRYRPRDTIANRYAGRNVSEFPGDQASAVIGLSHEWRPLDERLINVVGARGYAFHARGTPSSLTDPTAERPLAVTNDVRSFGASEAVRYFLRPTTLVKASIELARRLPGTAELFGDGLLIQPAPGLRPERSLNLNLGVQYDRAASTDDRFRAEANLFWMNLRDMMRLTQGFAGLAAYSNLGKARIAGFDAELKTALTPWLYGSANVTLQDARDVEALTPGTIVPSPTYNLRLPNLPWLFGGATLEAHRDAFFGPRQQSRVFYEAAFTDEYFYAFELSRLQERRIPRALTHTVGIEQQWFRHGWTVSAEIQNLTDATVLNQFRLPLPGRTFRFKARYTHVPATARRVSPSPANPNGGN